MKKALIIYLHAIFWGLVLWVLTKSFSFDSVEIIVEGDHERRIVNRDYHVVVPILFSLLGKIVFTYGHALWAFPKAFLKRKWMEYATYLLLLLAASFTIEFGLVKLYQWQYPMRSFTLLSSLQLNAFAHVICLGLSFAYAFARHIQHTEKVRRQLEQEKMATELSFLKAQINPHFLFNTLNNLFALAELKGNQDLSNGIAQLSQLMRYMIDHAQSDRILLNKEIECLHSVIDIQNLRHDPNDDFAIAVDMNGDPGSIEIAPLILIPFVENAFKHGIRVGQPSFIKITIDINQQQLQFKVTNSIHPDTEAVQESTGIGLINVKRRLELVYPDKHKLTIDTRDNIHSVVLDIDL